MSDAEQEQSAAGAGLLLAAAGAFLLYMGLDLLTGGALTGLITGLLAGRGRPAPEEGGSDD